MLSSCIAVNEYIRLWRSQSHICGKAFTWLRKCKLIRRPNYSPNFSHPRRSISLTPLPLIPRLRFPCSLENNRFPFNNYRTSPLIVSGVRTIHLPRTSWPSPFTTLHSSTCIILYCTRTDECDESFDREWLKKEARKVCQSKVEEEEAEHEQVCGWVYLCMDREEENAFHLIIIINCTSLHIADKDTMEHGTNFLINPWALEESSPSLPHLIILTVVVLHYLYTCFVCALFRLPWLPNSCLKMSYPGWVHIIQHHQQQE